MIRARFTAAALILLVAVTGCTSAAPTSTTETEGNVSVASELTWQEAKAKAQEMELEIAALIPEGKVVKVDQDETGLLFSCSGTQHNWTGSTIVALSKGTEGQPFVKALETHYQDSRFDIKTRLDIAGEYEVQLRFPGSAESYLVSGGWDPNSIRISSGSACFNLPEGVDPGGEF